MCVKPLGVTPSAAKGRHVNGIPATTASDMEPLTVPALISLTAPDFFEFWNYSAVALKFPRQDGVLELRDPAVWRCSLNTQLSADLPD